MEIEEYIAKKTWHNKKELTNWILMNMPDEYPVGYAHHLADKLVEEKKVTFSKCQCMCKHH